jgi:hypothetical protein
MFNNTQSLICILSHLSHRTHFHRDSLQSLH